MSALDRLNAKYARLGISLLGNSGGPTQADLLGGEPDELEMADILRSVGRGLLGGVQYIGETLDKPGRAVRGLLAGRPEELANLIPFSDTFGLTDPEQSTSGRDLLEQAGILSRNTPGLDAGDVAGFGAEVLLDPLTLVSGPAKGFTAAGKAAVKAGKILPKHTPEVAKAIRSGETSLLSVGLPWGDPLLSLGKGEMAAKAYEAVQYGRFSPLNPLRAVFGKETFGVFDPVIQKLGDEKAVHRARADAAGMQKIAELATPYYANQAQTAVALQDKAGASAIDAMNAVRSYERELGEKAGAFPSIGGIRQAIRAGGEKSSDQAVDAMAILQAERHQALGEVFGTTRGEEFHKRYPHNVDGDFSASVGMEYRVAPANLTKTPVGVPLSHSPELRAAAEAATGDPLLVARMSPAEMFQAAFGDVEETYRPILHDASRSWSELVPGEQLPKNVDIQNGMAQSESLAARFGEPYIAKLSDGKYHLFPSGSSASPQTFDTILEAKNATVPLMVPDPLKRIEQLAAVGSSFKLDDKLKSLDTLAKESSLLLQAFKGDDPNLVLRKMGVVLLRDLSPELREQVHKHVGKTLAEPLERSDLELLSKDFANWVGNGAATGKPEMDHVFGAMGHVLSRMWNGAGKAPGLQSQLSRKVIDTFDNMLKPDKFLGHVDAKRGVWLQQEAAHVAQIDGLVNVQNELRDKVNYLGGNIRQLQDATGEHLARKWSEELPKGIARAKYNELTGWMELVRNDALRNIPGMTGALRRISIDPAIAGIGLPDGKQAAAAVLNDAANYLTTHYGVGQDNAKELAYIMVNRDKKLVADRVPIFNNDTLADTRNYVETAARMQASLQHAWQFVMDTHQLPGGSVPLKDAWEELGLTKDGLGNLIQDAKAKGVTLDPETTLLDPKRLEVMKRYLTSHAAPEPNQWVKMWDAINRSYKVLLTAFPAKITRDFVSTAYNNWIAGAFTPTAYNEAAKILVGKGDQAMLNEAIAHGIIDRNSARSSDQFAKSSLEFGTSPFRQMFEPVGEAYQQAKQSKKDAFHGWINPFAEYASTADDVTARTQASKSRNVFVASAQAANNSVDALNRLAHYIARRREGYEPLAARESVAQTLFDYHQLNDFEKKYARRVMPFYSWSRNNLPWQLEQLINAPGGKSAQSLRAMNNLQQEAETNGWIPSFMRQRGGIPLGTDEAGNQEFITGTPFAFADLNNFVAPSDGDYAKPALRRTAENLMSQMNPLLTYPIEQYTGEQLWSGRPLKYLHGLTGSQELDNLMTHSPLARAVTTARRITDERKSWAAKLINLSAGFSVSDVSPEEIPKWQMIDLMNAAEAIAKDNPHLREFNKVYVKPEDIKNISPETQRLLAGQMKAADNWRQRKEAKQKTAAQPSRG